VLPPLRLAQQHARAWHLTTATNASDTFTPRAADVSKYGGFASRWRHRHGDTVTVHALKPTSVRGEPNARVSPILRTSSRPLPCLSGTRACERRSSMRPQLVSMCPCATTHSNTEHVALVPNDYDRKSFRILWSTVDQELLHPLRHMLEGLRMRDHAKCARWRHPYRGDVCMAYICSHGTPTSSFVLSNTTTQPSEPRQKELPSVANLSWPAVSQSCAHPTHNTSTHVHSTNNAHIHKHRHTCTATGGPSPTGTSAVKKSTCGGTPSSLPPLVSIASP
jgi:hypothetical protein